ncbi:nitric oxide synthase oxygenase, partial [Bacillus velezensis]
MSIVDEDRGGNEFKGFEEEEEDGGRKVRGEWSWVIRRMWAGCTHIFH